MVRPAVERRFAWNLQFGETVMCRCPGLRWRSEGDVAVYRPSTGTWFVRHHHLSIRRGGRTAGASMHRETCRRRRLRRRRRRPVHLPTFDRNLVRPGVHADRTTWSWIGWGTTGDTAAPADYDGDGRPMRR